MPEINSIIWKNILEYAEHHLDEIKSKYKNKIFAILISWKEVDTSTDKFNLWMQSLDFENMPICIWFPKSILIKKRIYFQDKYSWKYPRYFSENAEFKLTKPFF